MNMSKKLIKFILELSRFFLIPIGVLLSMSLKCMRKLAAESINSKWMIDKIFVWFLYQLFYISFIPLCKIFFLIMQEIEKNVDILNDQIT